MIEIYWNDNLVPEQLEGLDIENVRIKSCLLDGYYLEKGKPVARVYSNEGLFGQELFKIDTPISGFIRMGEPSSTKGFHNYYSRGSVLFSILSLEEMSSPDALYQIYLEPGTTKKRIRWTSLFNQKNKYNPDYFIFGSYLSISFMYDGLAHLLMRIEEHDFPMRVNDTISFLFVDGVEQKFIIHNEVKDQSHLFLDFELSKSDLERMSSIPIDYLQFESAPAEPIEQRLFYKGSPELGPILFQKFAKRFSDALQEIGFMWGIKEKDDVLSTKEPDIPNELYDLIVFDTETTGMPKSMDDPVFESSSWPHIVQISWVAVKDNAIKKKEDHIIKPDGFSIPSESVAIHRITNAYAAKYGESLEVVLSEFCSDVQASKVVVGHNLDYDQKVVLAELYRLQKRGNPFSCKVMVCTMKQSVNYCAFPGKNRWSFRYPKLEELYKKLFNKQMEGAHNSMHDVEATYECYKELIKQGVIM
ncbi:MAG: 3'-5' exonuclease [Paludibacteraceae bacterium]|nr:3'-5' exonuclease [Paludibacteraceae bacterium]